MNTMKILFHALLLLYACTLWSQAKKEGALIMISKEGEVGFLMRVGAEWRKSKSAD